MIKKKAFRGVCKNSLVIISLFFIFFVLLLPSCIAPVFASYKISNSVFAVQDNYSDVVSDLQIDESFNAEKYEINNEDYSLKIIQIAESVDKELFVYVYQPCIEKQLTATSINISTAINDSLKYINYKLKLLNKNNQFCKYLVEDFAVKEDALRYYDITSIYRIYDSTIDEAPPGDNTINEVSCAVNKLYTATTVNNQVSYSCVDTEVVDITDKWVGFIRYSNGFNLSVNSCDSHYIAFSTDRQLDNLLEADVTYITRDVKYDNLSGYTYGDYSTEYKPLYYDEKVSNTPGWFAEKRTWTRIEKASNFVANENLKDEVKKEIQNKQFILRFYESEYKTGGQYIHTVYHSYEQYAEVSNVTILRLTFETEGVVYNLGVVDNKQSGDNVPDNVIITLWDRIAAFFGSIFGTLWKTILFVLACIVLVPLLPYILKAVFYILKYLILAIYWLFAWPFYLKSEK